MVESFNEDQKHGRHQTSNEDRMKYITPTFFCIAFSISSFTLGSDIQEHRDAQLCIDTTKQFTHVVATAERCFAEAETAATEASRCARTLEVLHDVAKPNRRRVFSTIQVRDIDYTARLEFDAREGLCAGAEDCIERFPLTHYTLAKIAEGHAVGEVLLP